MAEATICLSGNLGSDPELRYGNSGKAYCKFSVAVTSGKDDNKVTLWQRCVCFERHAEDMGNLSKGDAVVIIGWLKPNSWEKDGVKHNDVELIVRAIGKALGQRRGEGAQQDSRSQKRDSRVSDNAGRHEPPPPEDEIPF